MPEPVPQPDPTFDAEPTPQPDPVLQPDPTPQPDPVPMSRSERQPRDTPPSPRIEHESTEPVHRDAPDTANGEASPPHDPEPASSSPRASTDDTGGLPRFNPSAQGPAEDDEDLLASTARLSRLMDQVTDRESDRQD